MYWYYLLGLHNYWCQCRRQDFRFQIGGAPLITTLVVLFILYPVLYKFQEELFKLINNSILEGFFKNMD